MDRTFPSSNSTITPTSQPYPLTMIEFEGTTRRPSKNERIFIDTIRSILNGSIFSERSFSAELTGWLRETAAGLISIFETYGEEGFWKAYACDAREHPILEPLKLLIRESRPGTGLEEIVHSGGHCSDFDAEPIDWLWKERLALGKLTTFDGDPGLGKSNIALDLAARISSGRRLPDGEPSLDGGVVIIAPEDGICDTIIPRLQKAGADMEACYIIGMRQIYDSTSGYTYGRPFNLAEDLPLLEQSIIRMEARLVIIDPIMAVLGTHDTYKDNEVRTLMAPLLALLEKHHTACIIVRHLTKSGGDNALYRGGGSIAFIGLARTGLAAVRDPYDNTRCVLAHIKSNIGKQAPALTYRIISDEEEGDERPYIQWGETSQLSTSELFSSPSAAVVKPAGSRQDILAVLREHYPESVTFSALAAELELNDSHLGMTLARMVKDGQIQKTARALYSANPH